MLFQDIFNLKKINVTIKSVSLAEQKHTFYGSTFLNVETTIIQKVKALLITVILDNYLP